MTGSRDIWDWLKDSVEALTFGNPIYNMMLGGRTVSALGSVPMDPWPGDAANGSALLDGEFNFANQTLMLDASPMTEAFWQPEEATDAWYAGLHSFHWLRDLRALGSDEARRQARTLVFGWLYCHALWSGDSWAPALAGVRIANWIGLHDFFFASADEGFRACIFDSLARQTRHLRRMVPGKLHGSCLISAIKGMSYGSLCLPDGDSYRDEAKRLLDLVLLEQILGDGGHFERTPSTQLAVLRDLIDIRSAFRAAHTEFPAHLSQTINHMTPALRFFRHGDGGLALFNGGREENPALVEAVLTNAESKGRPLRSAPDMRFERLHGGRALVILDAGAPPPPGIDRRAHAGTLSFEFSVGRERLAVNCGSHPELGNPWHHALAGTAAHTTLTVAETNSSEVSPKGGLGRRPTEVTCERRESADEITVIASHNGYSPNFNLLHRRTLHLDQHGDALHGEDVLEATPEATPEAAPEAVPNPKSGSTPEARPFAVRFHLHPGVQVQIVEAVDGPAVILKPHTGTAWRFTAEGGTLGIEDSIYCGTSGQPRHTLQIVVSGETGPTASTISWAFNREQPTS
ncbi:MAG: heparinase II/III family protein [Rhodospirillaceae bacterium]